MRRDYGPVHVSGSENGASLDDRPATDDVPRAAARAEAQRSRDFTGWMRRLRRR